MISKGLSHVCKDRHGTADITRLLYNLACRVKCVPEHGVVFAMPDWIVFLFTNATRVIQKNIQKGMK